jgi:hypothetical protein
MTDTNENNTASADESFGHCFVAGKTGMGKTTKLTGLISKIADESGYNTDILSEIGSGTTSVKSRKFFKRLLAESDDETGPVWFDPKGNPDTQNLDVSNINPLDVDSLDNDYDNGENQ